MSRIGAITHDALALSGPTSIELSATVYKRCACGTPNTDCLPNCRRCGAAAVIENHGTVAYWHRNRIMRAWRQILGWIT